ncbi:putative membrane protein [Streptomyces ambofaciens ATCC 23877]|uniref:Putative membrane protein n=1 Tax=Streptomyces ambofaciens (strain ATCC 23877 / 3486 / DSM 40053 / JCM 4204 / NBRC 12836 / NRRL B-2516) TaxID=278992 RepID=A0AD37_STRA7|nr:putative membrane protein [Streptomyces ambofaciens ATCC 23877]CAJ88392.1 putative membrane protein [Streptomyces ambofaciens ATCC 23877]
MSESVTTLEHVLGHNRRRRPTGARRATFGACALILGGGGLVAVNVFASATEAGDPAVPLGSSGVAATVDCPDLSERLTAVEEQARPDVDTELSRLDEQIATSYLRLQEAARTADDGKLDEGALLDPLKRERAATIERIVAAVDKAGARPEGLEALAQCTLRRTEIATPDAGNGGSESPGKGGDTGAATDAGDGGGAGEDEARGDGQQQPGNGGQAGNGPVAADYADIKSVQPGGAEAARQKNASRGSFATSCGVNAEGLFNSDNIIAAPGVSNGAHHFHDYVGNQGNDAFASDEDLAAAETSCADQGDRSSYYWPVLRLQNGTVEQDAESPGGGIEGNAGEIVTPAEVTLTFQGNERGEVTEMPRLLRIITGDAKAFVNGNTNANASWSCTGFEDRQLKDKYPLCPSGSDVVRTFTFQSCWDGRNIDSANHRTHVAFAAADGSCPNGFRPIPRLVQRVVYDVDAPSLQDGGKTVPLFAVDSFPEQLHKPVTDHSDFVNVFDEDLMREMVDCINSGRECGPDTPPGAEPGEGEGPQEQPTGTPDASQPPAEQTPTASAPADAGQGGQNDGKDEGNDEGNNEGDDTGQQDGGRNDTDKPEPPAQDQNQSQGQDQNQDQDQDQDQNQDQDQGQDQNQNQGQGQGQGQDIDPNPGEARDPNKNQTRDDAASPGTEPRAATTPADTPADTGNVAAPQATQGTGGGDEAAGSATEPQATQGGLAETGSGLGLWPAAVGGVLFAGGCLLLVRSRRRFQ